MLFARSSAQPQTLHVNTLNCSNFFVRRRSCLPSCNQTQLTHDTYVENPTIDTDVENSDSSVYLEDDSDTEIYDSDTEIYSLSLTELYASSDEEQTDNDTEFEDSFDNAHDDMLHIYYTNADNLLNKRQELEVEIEVCDPDIIVITEVFPKTCSATDILDKELQLDGYQLVKGTTTDKSRGVCILCKSKLRVQECKIPNHDNFKESCWCSIMLESGEKLLIGSIYRSPSSTDSNSKKLLNLINNAMGQKFDYTFIVGDFNYPSISWSDWSTPHNDTHPTFMFLECLRDNFLTQMVDKPTRVRDGQTANILDLVLVDKREIVDEIQYRNNLGASDHVALLIKLNFKPMCTSSTTVQRNFHKGNYDNIRKDLNEVNWNLMTEMSVEESYSYLLKKVAESVERNVPLKRPFQGKKRKKWITKECLDSTHQKFKAWKRYTHVRTHVNYTKYLKARNKSKKVVRNAKRNFERTVIANIKTNPKSFWSYIRDQTKTKSGIPDLLDSNDNLVYEDKSKADLLNNFFASVFVHEPSGQLPIFDIRHHGTPITKLIVDESTVLKRLKSLNITKSMGSDNLHPKLLYETADSLATPICSIMNKTFDSGKIPSKWKEANVTAIHKKGDKASPSNYRPISLTSIPCKMCEKTVRETIMNHMLTNNLFSDEQFGFRNKRSCVLQLLTTLDEWTKFYDEGYQIDVIYLDIMKAFDTIPHERLLYKLRNYGIEGNILDWIKDFLYKRRQRVRVHNDFSEWRDVTSGVPQGSVLGPVLFIMYMNDIPDAVEATCKIFADDTKIYKNVKTVNDQASLQRDLQKLCEWSKLWLLKFSIPKCKAMHLGYKRLSTTYEMTDHDNNVSRLPVCDEEKDLGITFQNNLKFDKQVLNVVNRTKKLTGMIKRTFTCMNRFMLLVLYKSLIRPIIDYGITVYFPTSKKNSKLIENIQRRATKIIPDLKDLPYNERLHQLNLPSLLYRRERFDMIQIFKLIHGDEDIDPEKFFTFNDNITRGHIFQIFKPAVNKTLRKNTFPIRCINLWNQLPEEIVTSDSVLSFKTKLDKAWSHKRFLYD